MLVTARRQQRCAELLDVVSLAGGTAEQMLAALLQIGPDADDCDLVKVRLHPSYLYDRALLTSIAQPVIVPCVTVFGYTPAKRNRTPMPDRISWC